MDKTYQILLFVTVPAVVGISLLAKDIYHVLYTSSAMGSEVLAHYAPVAILFALFQVTAALLQGIDFQKWIIFSLLTGIFVKLALNIPLIKLFEVDGAIMATAIGYGVSIIINFFVLRKVLRYRSTMVLRRTLLIVIFTAIMAFAVYGTHQLLLLIAPADSKMIAALYLIICSTVGIGVYGYLSMKTGLAQKLLGHRITKIAKKFGF